MNVISTINLLPSNKAEIEDFANQIINHFDNDDSQILNFKVQAKCFSEIIKKVESNPFVKKWMIDKLEKENPDYSINGNKISKGTKPTYDYSACNDSKINDLYNKLKELKEEIKERETVLKAHKSEWVDAETGEVINPPLVSKTDYLIIKLK